MTDTGPEQADKKLSANELAIMDILWRLGEASGKRVLAEFDRPLAQTTLLTYLARLEAKGYVKRRSGERGYVYLPAVERVSVASRLLDQALAQFDGRLSSLVSHFVQTRKLSDDERLRLRQVLDRMGEEEEE